MTKTLTIDPKKNPKKPKEDFPRTIDMTPRLSPVQYMHIVEMNMDHMQKRFGPAWTKNKKFGSVYTDIEFENMVESRRQFIQEWHDLLIADLEILDCIAQNKGYHRGHVPGVITKFTFDGRNSNPVFPSFTLFLRGRPLAINDQTDAQIEANGFVEAGKASTLKYEMECYFRGKGYEILEIKDEMGVSL